MIGRFPWDPFPPAEPEAKGPDPLHVALYRGAVAGADAYRSVRLAVRRDGGVLRVGNRFVPEGRYREVAFLAVGHAANSMALGALDALGERLTQGYLAGPERVLSRLPFRGTTLRPGWGGAEEAADVVQAAQEIASGLRASDLFLVLLSPGALRALAGPPPGMSALEFGGLLEQAHAAGASGTEVALLARALGTGGVGGSLVPRSTVADVETLVVDRGDGAEQVGGGPTVPVSLEERTKARSLVERLGLGPHLSAAARELLTGPPVAASPTNPVRRPVVVAGPSDALRGAVDAAFDRGWTSRVAFLSILEGPEAAAERLLERAEALVASEGGSATVRSKGVVAVTMLTLGLPEGVDDLAARRRFVERARDLLRRREMSVGLYPTVGSLGADLGPAGYVVGAPTDPDRHRPPGEIRALSMRRGITDVGLVGVAVAAFGSSEAGRGRSQPKRFGRRPSA